jgi:ACS family hexuronate transporter-like MFS transporter
VSTYYGWRFAFVLTGTLGFLWIPLWLYTARRSPRYEDPKPQPPAPLGNIARDPRLWGLIVANMLLMTVYILWVNWTTIYFVRVFGMAQNDVNRQLAWIPSIMASLGGLYGGWIAMRWIGRGADLVSARLRVILIASLVLLSTAALPWMPSPGWATVVICLSYFSCLAASVNLYALPLDLFGAGRAAFAVSTLTGAYGLMQAVFSPLAGALIDRHGFPPVCMLVSALPLASWLVLRTTTRR